MPKGASRVQIPPSPLAQGPGDRALPRNGAARAGIGYIRRKLEQGREPRLLHTVRGLGYVLTDRP